MDNEQSVLYLQFSKNIDENFLQLSKIFNKFNITLVPIRVQDLKSVAFNKRKYILAIVKDISSLKSYRKILSPFLNFMMRGSKVKLFEYSSFDVSKDMRLKKYDDFIERRLPLSLFEIVNEVKESLSKDIAQHETKWPGGRRGKLPSM